MAGNWRASLAVPMLRDGKSVGAISVGKAEAGPFKERQMQLLTTFADQAVDCDRKCPTVRRSAKAHRGDFSEALSQQTATSEVLSVISRSRGELEPVFNMMLANATKLCDAGTVRCGSAKAERFAMLLSMGKCLKRSRNNGGLR